MATTIMDKQKGSSLFYCPCKWCLSAADDEEDIKRVAQRIYNESKEAPVVKDRYLVPYEAEISKLCIPSSLSLLSIVSPKFRRNLKVIALISSMINSFMTEAVII